MKSVGNHYTGSKEDLTGKQEFGYQQNGQSNISPGKPERESNRNKLNYAEHQKVFEKAFISSVVQAELSQMAGARNSLVEGRMSRTTPDNSPCRLPLPPSSGGNSTGTGSSFGSLPSDGIADVIEARGMTSSGSSDPTTKPAVRLSKGKRNSATSFRYSALQGTVDSNTSTSSSESSFRGRNMKNSGPRCADTTTSSVDSRPRETVEHSGNIKSPAQRGTEGTPQSKIAPNRRSQSGSRISRFTAASKLPAPGKSPESRSTTPKSVFNTPSDLPPTPQASQTQRLKLAPLNYGINPPSSPNNPQINEPVYENAATFRQQRPAEKQTQHSNRIPGSSLRPPGSSIAIPSVSRPSAGCGPTQLDNRRTRKGIPSATGLHRPRPVYPGVGAG
uniref:Uncharacterized protein n=1 Tax=Ciona savignyi TaxID=51511 RepID=H2YC50_CIOSA